MSSRCSRRPVRKSRKSAATRAAAVAAVLASLFSVTARGQDSPPEASGGDELAASGDGSVASGDDGLAGSGGDGPAASGGGAEGWLEVARERTTLRYAYVLGESGDGASGELRVVLADRELTEEALALAAERDALAARDEARSSSRNSREMAGRSRSGSTIRACRAGSRCVAWRISFPRARASRGSKVAWCSR